MQTLTSLTWQRAVQARAAEAQSKAAEADLLATKAAEAEAAAAALQAAEAAAPLELGLEDEEPSLEVDIGDDAEVHLLLFTESALHDC